MATDAFHIFGNDLQVSATGDILLASDSTYGQQRVIRRLLTNTGAYIWHTEYGAGLGNFVGQPARISAISAITQSQMQKEEVVVQNPPPVVSVSSQDTIVIANIQYEDNFGNTSVLTLPLSDND